MNWPRWTDMYGHHILWVETYKSRYAVPRQGVWSTSNQNLIFRMLRLDIVAPSGTKSGFWGPKIMKPPRARTRMQKKSRKSVLCFWNSVNTLPMGIAIGSDVFGRISPTFGLSGLFLHFQPSAYFSREYMGGGSSRVQKQTFWKIW